MLEEVALRRERRRSEPGSACHFAEGAEIDMGRMGKVKLDDHTEGAMADPFVYDAKNVDQFAKIF